MDALNFLAIFLVLVIGVGLFFIGGRRRSVKSKRNKKKSLKAYPHKKQINTK